MAKVLLSYCPTKRDLRYVTTMRVSTSLALPSLPTKNKTEQNISNLKKMSVVVEKKDKKKLSREDELLVIAEVKKNPNLWDTSDIHLKVSSRKKSYLEMRETTWQKIDHTLSLGKIKIT
jgi:hypothetical protein